jgi:hypothetical protein
LLRRYVMPANDQPYGIASSSCHHCQKKKKKIDRVGSATAIYGLPDMMEHTALDLRSNPSGTMLAL